MNRRGLVVLSFALLFSCVGREEWGVVFEQRPGALISVWGTSSTDVWAVGGDSGSGPEVLHFDGKQWNQLKTGTSGDLWWVFGFPNNGPVFLGGAKGTTLRLQGKNVEVLAPAAATTGTVFGIWGAAANDVWAVGGDGNSNAFAWRFDGTSWRDVPLPGMVKANNSLFKVWGSNANDVWFVGSKGLSLHWTGNAFEVVPTPTNRTLFTLDGNGNRLAAVGGFGSAVVLEYDGAAWVDVSPPEAKQLIGVRLTASGGWAVGMNGSVMKRGDKGWEVDKPAPEGLFEDLHGVWVDEKGGVWAVGGQVAALPLIHGVLAYRGRERPTSTVK